MSIIAVLHAIVNGLVEERASSAWEARVDGNVLSGVVMEYGSLGQGGTERFSPGAFSPVPATTVLDLQHDPLMVLDPAAGLVDSEERLELRAELRPNSAALSLVKRGTLTGLSVRFAALEEKSESGVRVISRARLARVGLVDLGAYPRSTVGVS